MASAGVEMTAFQPEAPRSLMEPQANTHGAWGWPPGWNTPEREASCGAEHPRHRQSAAPKGSAPVRIAVGRRLPIAAVMSRQQAPTVASACFNSTNAKVNVRKELGERFQGDAAGTGRRKSDKKCVGESSVPSTVATWPPAPVVP